MYTAKEADCFAALIRRFELSISPRALRDFFVERDRKNIKKNRAMYRLVDELQCCARVALLSNVSKELSGRLRASGHYPKGVRGFFSFKMGIAKPDPRAYRNVLQALGVNAKETVFIDDNERNVRAARRLGMHAVLHTSPAVTVAAVRKILAQKPGAPL